MVISKGAFRNIINNIIKQYEIDDDVGSSLEKVCGNYVIFNSENLIYKSMFDLLAELTHDESDCIGWWFFDTGCGARSPYVYYEDENDKSHLIQKAILSADDLYDLLEENYNEYMNSMGKENIPDKV